MPELPEVEVVRRALEPSLIGLKITNVEIRYEGIILDDISYFKENVIGKTIKSISRHGKFLIFNLNEGHIVSHLRMEGKYFYLKKNTLDNKHIHVIYDLSNGYQLLYQDVRKFGIMTYKESSELYKTKPLSDVGVDLILNDNIDIDLIYKKINKKSIPIKTVLLDQSILAGLGNIYVDEVLFLSKINPLKKASLITIDDLKNIIKYSKEVMQKSIEFGGTTIRSYTSSLGVTGSNQNNLYVHTKKICPICGSEIIKDYIGGRGSYYCPNCQK